MSNRSIGFIGGGRITRIFLEGWTRAGKLPASITVSDPNTETLTKLKTRFPAITTTPDNAQAAGGEIVFLAVHPPVMAEVAAGIKGSVKPGALVVSLAPKFTFAKLTELLGGFARLVRVIPNAPSVVNFGFNPMAFGPGLSAADKAEITGLLSPLGGVSRGEGGEARGVRRADGDGSDLFLVPTSGLEGSSGGLWPERGGDRPGDEADGVRGRANAAGIGSDSG
jgi:pyrroline-5-carboxylate reductase